MITITIVGTTPPCAKCKRAEREALSAAQPFGDQVTVVKIDALSDEADAYGLVVTPTVAIDGEVIASGRIARQAEITEYLQKRLGGI